MDNKSILKSLKENWVILILIFQIITSFALNTYDHDSYNKGITPLDNIANNDTFTNTRYNTIPGSGLVSLVAGDRIWLSVKNETSGADITVRHANINIKRI